MSATNFAKIRKLVIEISCLKKWLHTHRRYRVGCTIIGRSTLFTWSLCSNSGALQAWARVAKPPKMSLNSHRETYWSRIKRSIVRNFQILIVSAVEICKQCLQTASASVGLLPTGASPLDPTGGLPSLDSLSYSFPQWKFLVPPVLCSDRHS